MCILLFAAKTCHVHDYAERHLNERMDALIANMEQGTEDPLAKVVAANDEEVERRRRTAGEFSQEARKVTAELFDRIEKFNVGTLGWVGFGFLLWTVISSMGMVEVSFNGIWGVEKPRKIWQRAWLYLLLALLLPPVAAAAMSLTVLAAVKSAIASVSGAAGVAEWFGRWAVTLIDSAFFRLAATGFFASLAFASVFWLLPNRKVRFSSAFAGGAVTAALFGGWMKLCAVAQIGIAKSSALYGSFAFFPIVLAWVYMSWQIVLLGACFVRTAELRAQATA
jgi:membrane protein